MHHTLKLYGGNRKNTLRVYMFFARWTRIPLAGRMVRRVANAYGRNMHRAYLLTPAEAEELVAAAEGVALTVCDCRKLYHRCDNPLDTEILLGPTRHVMREAMPEGAREIDREEALEVLRENHRRGLIFTILKCHGDFYAICSCCTCCCVPLRLSRQYGIGDVLTRHSDIVGEFREYQAACLTGHQH
jgi:hypothetical protein